MIEDRERYTGAKLYAVLAFFALIALVAFWFFFTGLYGLVTGILTEQAVIEFNKGSFYMLGAGLGAALLCFAGFYESVLGRVKDKRYGKWIGTSLIASLIIAFLLPSVAHYGVSQLSERRGYAPCEEASTQWLYLRNIVYTRTSEDCEAVALRDE